MQTRRSQKGGGGCLLVLVWVLVLAWTKDHHYHGHSEIAHEYDAGIASEVQRVHQCKRDP